MTKEEAVKIALRIIENDIDVKVNCSGAKKVIQDALTKQLPIKPLIQVKPITDTAIDFGFCPNCYERIISVTDYCPFCGQKLDWEKGTKENESIY